ncbi:hypothetical protein [Chrysiogenes arsenatis]|uniref:hypothetical protein n=1 Tax=Chrysiogenes arsenatis TaxID=309797 RepID=UPI000406A3CD|nr:hypothetical protein [Chrysiogenes arsenatis]
MEDIKDATTSSAEADEGLRENRAQIPRLFTFAMTFSAISMVSLVGKIMDIF